MRKAQFHRKSNNEILHQEHKFYCGIDIHARTMYLCILDQEGKILLHRDIKTEPVIFLKTIDPNLFLSGINQAVRFRYKFRY